jgi:hypothetical protein
MYDKAEQDKMNIGNFCLFQHIIFLEILSNLAAFLCEVA